MTNRGVWDLEKAPVGCVEPFLVFDEKGARHRLQSAYDEIREGDRLWGYVGGRGVVAQLTCTASLHCDRDGAESICVRKDVQVPTPISFATLKSNPIIAGSRPLRCGCRGTLFELSASEYAEIGSCVGSLWC